MNKAFLQGTVASFRASANDVTRSADFAYVSAMVRPRIETRLVWDGMTNEDKTFFKSFVDLQVEPIMTYQGLCVRLIASFETFLRSVIIYSVKEINEETRSFDVMDDNVRKRNRQLAGRMLATACEPVEYQNLDYDDICRHLGTSVPGHSSTLLCPMGFATLAKNASVRSVEESLGAIGIKINWDDFSREDRLKKLLGQTGTRDAAKALKVILAELQQKRNAYAHDVGGGEIDNIRIRLYAGILIELATILASVVQIAIVRKYALK